MAFIFGVGVLVGWMILGWWLFPVRWRNAHPTNLAPGYQTDYLAMVADSYAQNKDRALARRRLEGFSPEQIRAAADELEGQRLTAQAQSLRELAPVAGQPGMPQATSAVPTREPGGTQVQLPAKPTTLGERLKFVLGVILLAVLLVIGVMAGAALYSRATPPRISTLRPEERRLEVVPSWRFHEASLGYPVTAGFAAGDAGYKESFQIKDPFHELLGDCGLMIAEGLGSIPADRVPGLEIWLYDKEDGRTESAVLLSEHAFRDRSMYMRMVGAGRVERAEVGKVLQLETGNLRLEAEILDVSYVEPGDDVPPNAYFARLDVRLTPTAKEQGPEAG